MYMSVKSLGELNVVLSNKYITFELLPNIFIRFRIKIFILHKYYLYRVQINYVYKFILVWGIQLRQVRSIRSCPVPTRSVPAI